MTAPLSNGYRALRRSIQTAAPIPGVREIELAVGTGKVAPVVAFRMSGRDLRKASSAIDKIVDPLIRDGRISGAAAITRKNRILKQWGEIRLAYDYPEGSVPGAPFTLHQAGWSFSQASWETNLLLIQTVLRAVGDDRPARLLELYAGSGNFTLPLAKLGLDVVAVEGNAAAARSLSENLREAQVPARVIHLPAAAAVRKGGQPDVVLMDPPRTGAAALIPDLIELAPGRIVYVSCDPAVLARDLSALARGGYRLATVQPLDLFPQTYHVETVATCVAEGS